MSDLSVSLQRITGVHRPVTGQSLNEIRTSRNTILDITETVRKLGLDPNGDVIFDGSDAVAVEKWSPHTPPYNTTNSPIVVLKTTNEANLGEHALVVTGESSKRQSKGQQVTINLKVIVE